jgi:hypothetical protein
LGTDPDTNSAAVLLFSAPIEPYLEQTSFEIHAYIQKPVTYRLFLTALTKAGIQADF